MPPSSRRETRCSTARPWLTSAAKLLDSGLDYYFLRALKLARVGVIVEQSARIAMAGASRVLASVIRNVLVRMNGAQLIAVCGHLRHLME